MTTPGLSASALKPRNTRGRNCYKPGIRVVEIVSTRASTTRINPTTESFRRELLSKSWRRRSAWSEPSTGPSSAPRARRSTLQRPSNGTLPLCALGGLPRRRTPGAARDAAGADRAEASGANPALIPRATPRPSASPMLSAQEVIPPMLAAEVDFYAVEAFRFLQEREGFEKKNA